MEMRHIAVDALSALDQVAEYLECGRLVHAHAWMALKVAHIIKIGYLQL